MNHLLVKTKDDKNSYKKIISNKEIYEETYDLSLKQKYQPDNSLDEEYWYYIEKFSLKKYCIDLLKKSEFNSARYSQTSDVDPEKIHHLVSYQREGRFLFQRVYSRNILKKKRILSLGDSVEIKDTKQGIVINDIPDAIYVVEEDCLYFQKLETISPIFKGINELYREATKEETKIFLDNEFIVLEDGFCVDNVKKMNRKRIAMAMKYLGKFSEKEKNEIFVYTSEYFPGLNYNGNSFEIHNDEELKELLFGIDQRLYTTPVTKEKRCASTVMSL